jgi:hypothetical protein
MASEPKLNEWKPAPKPRPVSVADPISIPDAPEPSADPGALAPIPLLYPFGPTPFSYLYGLISTLDAGLPLTGGVLTGTLSISAEPSAQINLQSRYTVLTDNAGTPGHSVSGPNLIVHDVAKNVDVLQLVSIGQMKLTLKSTDLANNIVAHGLQLIRQAAGGAAGIGMGGGIQVFLPDSADTLVECANIQVDMASVTPAAVNARLIFRACIAGVPGVSLFHTTSVGNFVGDLKVLAVAGLGAGNSVAATVLTAPGTVIKRLPIFDEAGVLLGSVPVYSAGSFS